MLLQSILDDCGLNVSRYESVHGGDISQVWRIYTPGTSYFLKVNDADLYPGMFRKEEDGLAALANELLSIDQAAILKIPQVIKTGTVDRSQYLLMEWIDKGKPGSGFWESFGSSLALLHKKQQPYFGWTQDNYIGNLAQINTKRLAWHEFYAECRIIPLVKKLFDAGLFSKRDIDIGESFCQKLVNYFPQEFPSLLHGDLWAGNFMITSAGIACVYDPAVYSGHREMDIGMSRLFGGFDQRFYTGYNDRFPLEKNWHERLPLTQLYPLLVHAVLFGGHYVGSAREIIKRFS